MEQDLALLQNISETLKSQPHASQRQLAKNANISLGMMNAILGRFVERGWIMLTNVNARKLAYALTADGIAELANRSRQFAKRTFEIVNKYNEILEEFVQTAKNEGKSSVVLYGNSYIKFLLSYICNRAQIEFEERMVDSNYKNNSLCFIGELESTDVQYELYKKGCINLIDILNN